MMNIVQGEIQLVTSDDVIPLVGKSGCLLQLIFQQWPCLFRESG